jgi:hypothetical protein
MLLKQSDILLLIFSVPSGLMLSMVRDLVPVLYSLNKKAISIGRSSRKIVWSSRNLELLQLRCSMVFVLLLVEMLPYYVNATAYELKAAAKQSTVMPSLQASSTTSSPYWQV